MKQKTFRKTQIATSLSLVLGVAALSPTFANAADKQAKEKEVEVITVTGMRSSIKESTRLKRDATGVVDAISAEDIGKFPDTNLAESLQRITGVSIDRSNGEGSRVTVRGFGPQFNMVTLNGRTMPATSLPGGGGASDSRAYDFQNLASDAVKSVEVYKTGKANVATGGIGATININTAKPLDNPGFIASFGGKALADTSVRGGVRDYSSKVTPEFSGLVSWTDPEEVFGISLNGSVSQRDSSSTGAEVAQWRNSLFNGTVPDMTPTGAATVLQNAPAMGDAFALPSNLAYQMWDRQRDRTNAQLTLQYRPAENITATLDYTYTKLKQDAEGTELSIWMSEYKSDITFTDGLNPSPLTYIEDRRTLAPRDIATKQRRQSSQTEDKSLGFNLNWEVNDRLTFVLDAHDSSSDSTPRFGFGNELTVGIGSNIIAGQGATYNASGMPDMFVKFDDCDARIGLNCSSSFDVSDLGSSILQKAYSTNSNDISQIRINGSYEFDDGSIDFGVESRKMDNYTVQSNLNQAMGNWGVANPGELPTNMIDAIDFNDALDDYKLSGWTQGFRGDAIELANWGADKYGLDLGRNPDSATNRRIEEDITSLYFQINVDGELGEMPYHFTAGLRYESTDSTSTANIAFPTAVKWDSNNDFTVMQGSASNAQALSITNSYDHLLPNLDFDIDVRDDLKARFSYSKTIARPSYGQLNSAAQVNGGPPAPTILGGGLPGSASSGNPSLVPLESDNLDLSLEWYFADTSYVSVGFFEKRVSNFVGSEPVKGNFFGLRDPSAGPRAQQAIDDLTAQGINVNETSLFSMMAANQLGEAIYANGHTDNDYEALVDIFAESDDPLMEFQYQSPVNNKDAKINGWELAAQHFFGDSGFGVQANYTIVRGDIGFDLAAAPTVTQFALLGLSDTANLVVMYEKDDWSARVAYNWRDQFLNNAARDASEPEFIEAYSQIDMSVSYQVNDQLSVSFAGINLTGEDPRSHGRTKNMLWAAEEWDARYEVGVRYTF